MTDLEILTKAFEDMGIKYRIDKYPGVPSIPVNDKWLILDEENDASSKWTGYTGFEIYFVFDEEGNLTEYGADE